MSEKSISKKNVVNPTLFILWQKKISFSVITVCVAGGLFSWNECLTEL